MTISVMMATIRTRLECSNSGGIYRKLADFFFFSLLDNFSLVISPFFRPQRKDWLTVEEYPDHRLQSGNHYIIKVFFLFVDRKLWIKVLMFLLVLGWQTLKFGKFNSMFEIGKIFSSKSWDKITLKLRF